VNADKIARDEEQRMQRLRDTLELFFDTLAPMGKMELLRECVLHEIGDEFPDRVMWEEEILRELADIGFDSREVRVRLGLATLVTAHKPD
jgi:hypothetical protein